MHAVIQQLIPHRSQNPFLYIFTAGQTALGYVGPRRESLRSIVRQFAWDNDEEQKWILHRRGLFVFYV